MNTGAHMGKREGGLAWEIRHMRRRSAWSGWLDDACKCKLGVGGLDSKDPEVAEFNHLSMTASCLPHALHMLTTGGSMFISPISSPHRGRDAMPSSGTLVITMVIIRDSAEAN